MKVIAKEDGSVLIDLANTLLVSRRTACEQAGDTSRITARGGYFLGFNGGRLRTCWAAVKWIWRADNGEVPRG